MKKILIFIVIVLIVAAGVYAVVRNKSKDNSSGNSNTNTTQNTNSSTGVKFSDLKSTADSDTVLYVGDGCPHCTKVESYIKENKIDEKLPLDVKEVWYNKENSDDLNKTAQICKIPEKDLGVPLLLDKPNSKCYVGEDEITNFLNSKVNAQ